MARKGAGAAKAKEEPALKEVLQALHERAREASQPQATRLKRGLNVRLTDDGRMLLWRETGRWEPGEKAEKEAHICAACLGWTKNHYTLHWNGKYLCVYLTQGVLS